ncbi:hypothetical protein [Streptomyces alboflavus]|uniref:hypothetical protein n=1 Tax=Streptomyces alboflavus TaxID=67267 RepID=UPI0013317066|nr:hypothetical protein [Streptomyces alboflavus]
MAETNERGPNRNIRTYGFAGAAVVIAVSLLLAYLLGAFDSTPRERIKADSVCANLRDKEAAADIFNRALPRSTHYDFRERLNPSPDYSYRINCQVVNDGDDALLDLTSTMGFSAPWKNWESKVIEPRSKGKVFHFDAGIKGISTPNLAGIYVPCYSKERSSKRPHNLSVYALAVEPLHGSAKEKRQELVDLALDFARSTHKQAKCDRPSELPDRAEAPVD